VQFTCAGVVERVGSDVPSVVDKLDQAAQWMCCGASNQFLVRFIGTPRDRQHSLDHVVLDPPLCKLLGGDGGVFDDVV
jgi:hypothetical protein